MKKLIYQIFIFSIFSTLGLAQEKVFIKGDFQLDNLYEGHFVLLKKNNYHFLKITVLNESCEYEVDNISPPQQTRGLNGRISSKSDQQCTFKTSNELANKLLNSFILFDVEYRFNPDSTIAGVMTFRSIEKTFHEMIKSKND